MSRFSNTFRCFEPSGLLELEEQHIESRCPHCRRDVRFAVHSDDYNWREVAEDYRKQSEWLIQRCMELRGKLKALEKVVDVDRVLGREGKEGGMV